MELAETKEETAILERTNESLRATIEEMETERDILMLQMEEKTNELAQWKQQYDGLMNQFKVCDSLCLVYVSLCLVKGC